MSDKIQELELKIVQLENQLKELVGPKEIDPEDLKTWRKVSGQLGIDPDLVGGINECKPVPFVCRVCRICTTCFVCTTCIVCRVCRICNVCYECSCGPCAGSLGNSASGLSRFNEFG
jgi:hypothetical protein